ncbi:MAG: tRNA uridine-5-carboxymethylaminomethyl(34) synthesis GTPase MnmE [Firmicutes bacterium]|nr:tRNA uridine-5-carboxymethylaminomethyl(34) synthesis GTPase MnmE [Bacillota bacterium]
MTDYEQETIVAIATPPGQGGIGVIRLSGPSAADILAACQNIPLAEQQQRQARRLYLHDIFDEQGRLIDRALTVFMPGPASYTGEDVAEIQCHGGTQALSQILAAALAHGARLAQAGEFSLRAFLNGKIDLSQAEAIGDLVAAKTAAGARNAAGQLAGRLGRHIAKLESRLTAVQAAITAAVDFPDEVDEPQNRQMAEELTAVAGDVQALLDKAPAGQILRQGLGVALAGPVNAGKSSLLNQILGFDRAIVTDCPGTTRDMLEEYIDLDGLPLLLRDTAGLRRGADISEPERIGMDKSRDALERSQIVLLVADLTDPAFSREHILPLAAACAGHSLLVLNKRDAAAERLPAAIACYAGDFAGEDILPISAKTGQGMPELLARLKEKAGGARLWQEEDGLLVNARQRQALQLAAGHIREALAGLEQALPQDLITIDLEAALTALAAISGRDVGEEVLNDIFRNFCVGK